MTPKEQEGPMLRIYFQTQGLNYELASFHSDGCTPQDQINRQYFHALLDEWIDSLQNLPEDLPKSDLLVGPSLVFGICHGVH